MKVSELSKSEIWLSSREDFKEFLKHVFKYSGIGDYKKANHVFEWADIIQWNKEVTILSARLHLKSTTIYAFLMWYLFCHPNKDVEVLYLSYKKDMAQYHTKKLKEMIKKNIFFEEFKDLTTAEGILKYTLDDEHRFIVEPEGILSFKRGRHPDIVICDDILADPSQELNLQVINKITRIFFEEVINMPKKEGNLFLIGTAQHQEDLFFQIKKRTDKGEIDFHWSEWKAILNEKEKKVLWPEQFPYEWLVNRRTINEKAFNKEFMCSPVYSEDAYFQRDELSPLINLKLKNVQINEDKKAEVIAGFDVGKHVHPSHFAVFKIINKKRIMIYERFFVNEDYVKQIRVINGLIENLKIDRINYDATRGELESFKEDRVIKEKIWKPITFTTKTKGAMAANFGTIVSTNKIELINDDKMIRSILSVNNKLEALETVEGHGDAFWSIALALYEGEKEIPFAAEFA